MPFHIVMVLWWLWVGLVMAAIYLIFGAAEPLIGYSIAFLIFGLPTLIMLSLKE